MLRGIKNMKADTMFKRNVYIAILLMTMILTFLLYLRIGDYSLSNIVKDFNDDGNYLFSNNDNYVDSNDINTSKHYKLLILITSKIEEFHHRKLLRRILFGIDDNLVPCMKYDTNIYYKFLIPPYNINKKLYGNFVSENVEYNDIAQSSNISFDHAVLLDDYSIISLAKLKKFLVISNLSPIKLQNIVWSNFDDSFVDDMFVILEYYIPKDSTIAVRNLYSKHELLSISKHLSISPVPVCHHHVSPSIAIVTSSYFHDRFRNCSPSMLNVAYMTSENKRMYAQRHNYAFVPRSLEFQPYQSYNRKLKTQGRIDAVKKVLPHYEWVLWIDNDAIITNHEISIQNLFNRFYQLVISKKKKKNNPNKTNAKNSSIKNVSNTINKRTGEEYYYDEGGPLDYDDDPFDDANYDKEVYDEYYGDDDLGYYNDDTEIFYEDEEYESPGVIDYDDDFFDYAYEEDEDFEVLKRSEIGKKIFDKKIHFIVSRPKKDIMLNAGVFLIRNSNWSFEFLERVQTIKDMHNGKKSEQASMWKLLKKYPNLRNHTLLIRDDHILNTFPDFWQKDDFTLHCAPYTCPAKFMLDYFENNKD
ncbi:34457_t:CDS:2 [Gigaspora margarita]|uniref:34457_t:CDS:1 n=1 Tax=Gigaspora margarita TaxID=4874 RepID=A0ABN7VP17_GIGMA|nr:34457_t:CDS:2 [Gigaspora margarita]